MYISASLCLGFAGPPLVVSSMTLQVVEAQVFDESNQKKNIKARVSLSDGLSKIIVMVPDKVYLQIVSQALILIIF